MPTVFTPVQATDPEKERDWPYQIGLLDWDDTKIVFSKRTLLEFLRYTGTSVDTNMSNISKLPRYCTFGTLKEVESLGESAPPEALAASESEPPTSVPTEDTEATSDGFVPTRRVREAPGGTQRLKLFEEEFPDDALAKAPSHNAPKEEPVAPSDRDEWGQIKQSHIPGFKPTRRVRDNPGGKSEIGTSLFG